jgi:hypothetical protein
MSSDIAFQSDHVLVLQVFLPLDRYSRKDQEKTRALVNGAISRMSAVPGVKSAGATNFLLLIGF